MARSKDPDLGQSDARQYWDRPSDRKPPPPPVSKRRYAVAVLLGAAVVFASSEVLFRIVGSLDARLAGYVLGIFAAGWNTRARTVKAWVIVGALTVAAVWAIGLAGLLLVSGD